MKYRIKIITYKNGRKEYTPQFKGWLSWLYIWWDGSTTPTSRDGENSREEALKLIDKHFSGNHVEQTIEFEYINK
jgi:hypothetical protein